MRVTKNNDKKEVKAVATTAEIIKTTEYGLEVYKVTLYYKEQDKAVVRSFFSAQAARTALVKETGIEFANQIWDIKEV